VSNIRHTKLIGYGAMLGEGTLALAATIAAVAGISLVANCNLPAVGRVEDLSWAVYYDSWAHAATNKATAFVLGGGALIESLGIQSNMAKTIMAVLVISFAATTLDTATRIQRFILMEVGDSLKIQVLKNRYIATLIAIIPALWLTLWQVTDQSTGLSTQAGWVLWPIFGASNQMLAALTLMILSIYFWKRNRPVLPLVIPFIFITIITLTTLMVKIKSFAMTNRILLVIDGILIALILWMLYEGWTVFRDRSHAK
jgi:carbon starvation protein